MFDDVSFFDAIKRTGTKMKRIRFKVDLFDILAGVPNDVNTCPVAIAMRRALKKKYGPNFVVDVRTNQFSVSQFIDGQRQVTVRGFFSTRTSDWINSYDNATHPKTQKPFIGYALVP